MFGGDIGEVVDVQVNRVQDWVCVRCQTSDERAGLVDDELRIISCFIAPAPKLNAIGKYWNEYGANDAFLGKERYEWGEEGSLRHCEACLARVDAF